jgi:hypothetical protein
MMSTMQEHYRSFEDVTWIADYFFLVVQVTDVFNKISELLPGMTGIPY